jgi:hypothetical protein
MGTRASRLPHLYLLLSIIASSIAEIVAAVSLGISEKKREQGAGGAATLELYSLCHRVGAVARCLGDRPSSGYSAIVSPLSLISLLCSLSVDNLYP